MSPAAPNASAQQAPSAGCHLDGIASRGDPHHRQQQHRHHHPLRASHHLAELELVRAGESFGAAVFVLVDVGVAIAAAATGGDGALSQPPRDALHRGGGGGRRVRLLPRAPPPAPRPPSPPPPPAPRARSQHRRADRR